MKRDVTAYIEMTEYIDIALSDLVLTRVNFTIDIILNIQMVTHKIHKKGSNQIKQLGVGRGT